MKKIFYYIGLLLLMIFLFCTHAKQINAMDAWNDTKLFHFGDLDLRQIMLYLFAMAFAITTVNIIHLMNNDDDKFFWPFIIIIALLEYIVVYIFNNVELEPRFWRIFSSHYYATYASIIIIMYAYIGKKMKKNRRKDVLEYAREMIQKAENEKKIKKGDIIGSEKELQEVNKKIALLRKAAKKSMADINGFINTFKNGVDSNGDILAKDAKVTMRDAKIDHSVRMMDLDNHLSPDLKIMDQHQRDNKKSQRYSDEIKNEICVMFKQGIKNSDIAKELKVHPSTVSREIKKYKIDNNL